MYFHTICDTFLVIPEYKSGTITCGTQSAPYPNAPTSAKMQIDSADNQPVIMCPGESARYLCNAGGINAIKVYYSVTIGFLFLFK